MSSNEGHVPEGTKNTAGSRAASGAGSNKLIGILALILIASLAFQAFAFTFSMRQNQKVNKFIDNQLARQAEEEEQLNEYIEDGFVVGEHYTITSTKAISDAYLSGDTSALSEDDKKTLELAEEVLKERVKDDMSDYEKEKAVYEWIFENVTIGSSTSIILPGRGGDDYTAGGVLRSHNAVCVGYATTFRLFMNMLGMECHIVHNDGHSWDLVKMDDGEWYHTDIYSDVSGYCEYSNFNMNDDQCLYGHDWPQEALPEAKGLKYTTPVQMKQDVDTIYEIPSLVKAAMDHKKKVVYAGIGQEITDEDVKMGEVISNLLNDAAAMIGKNISFDCRWYQGEDDKYIFGVALYDGEGGDVLSRISRDSISKMQKAINKVFELDENYSYYDQENSEDIDFSGDINTGDTDKGLTGQEDAGSQESSADGEVDG